MQDKIDLLSPREREVLRLMGTGMYMAEIAAKLSLSQSTVNTQGMSAAGKLGARHSYHAAILFLRHELQEEFKRATWAKK